MPPSTLRRPPQRSRLGLEPVARPASAGAALAQAAAWRGQPQGQQQQEGEPGCPQQSLASWEGSSDEDDVPNFELL